MMGITHATNSDAVKHSSPAFTFHNPPSAPPPAAPYSQVCEASLGSAKLLILSGQTALQADGSIVGENDLGAQSAATFDAIEAILVARGASLANIVHLRTYVTDMRELRAYGLVRLARMGETLPASTTVEVSALFRSGLMIEVEATAIVPISAE